ncbi:MAG: ABC transporter permease, partial [Candidatus Thermoplasmatota archaeon]|nr:ABC transporter permease [Candidatus Thermoplasmatota archaeon]MBU1940349.1 ABC transporter permease [Candidatus Thermoplasmatota archaeon]
MSNLKHMLRWEFILLSRYKIIHISILSVILYFLTTQAVESLKNQTQVHSVLLFFDPALIGIMFVGALVLFEKSENVLQALVITPMKIDDYLLSKMISLTILSILSATLFMSLMIIFNDVSFNLFYLVVGIILTSVMLILLGFIIVSRVDSINGYLLGMMIGFIGLTFPPILQLFGILENPIFYIWPTQASFILFDGVFHAAALESWEII